MKQFYFKIAKKTFLNLFLGIGLLLAAQGMQAATITSAQSGSWTDTSTWVGGVVPVAADYVIVASEHNLTFALTAATTLGGLNVQSGASLTVTGNFTFSLGNVSPFSNIAGNLTIIGTSSRTIGNLTVTSSGTISSTGGATSIASSTTLPWVNNGTITIATLGYPTGKIFDNNGTLTCAMGSTSAGTLNNNSGATLTLTGTVAGNINNFGTMNSAGLSGTAATAIINNKASGVLNFTNSTMSATNLVLNTTEAGNTVIYNSATSQTIKNVVYSNLTIDNAGDKTIPTAASGTLCTGTFTILGTSPTPSLRALISNTNVKVNALVYGGETKAAGTYGGPSSTATAPTTKFGTNFTGVGYLIVEPTLGVAQFNENEMKLYPNPSKGGKFTISFPSSNDEANVSVLNLAGETVYVSKIAAGADATISPNNTLAVGVYFVKVEQAGNTVTKKLIVN